jgi:iron complex outermembrane receptor protein
MSAAARAARLAGGWLLLVPPVGAAPPAGPPAGARVEARAPASAGDGEVTVELELGPGGELLRARAVSGPPGLRRAAEAEAARALPPGQGPGRVTVLVAFVVDDAVIEIEVVDEATALAPLRSVGVVDAAALQRRAGQPLAQVVASLPGVVSAGGQGDTHKPMIRGHTERRLLILVDGVPHEGQKWGADHAPEVDPASAGQIQVLRGAAAVRHGPEALAGVIQVDPLPLPVAPGASGQVGASFASNGRRPWAGGRVDLVPARAPAWALRLEGNATRGRDLEAPGYTLGNTAHGAWNAGLAVARRSAAVTSRLTLHHHELLAGTFYGVQLGTVADFDDQLAAGRPPTADAWTPRWAVDRPKQAVTHDQAALHVDLGLPAGGRLSLLGASQRNHRREYEAVRPDVEGPQYEFILNTHSAELRLLPAPRGLRAGQLHAELGVQGALQDNIYRGLPLLPNYRMVNGGAYGLLRLRRPRQRWELGARADGVRREVYFEDDEHQRHARRGTLGPADCDPAGALWRCGAAQRAASLTAGWAVDLRPDALTLTLEGSTASRFPDVDELYLFGTAPTWPVYAVGDPSLPVETSRGGSLSLQARAPALAAELSVYGQAITDYIAFQPARNPDGSLHVDVTVRGAFPGYTWTPVDARFTGLDGVVELGPEAPVGLRASGAAVRGVEAATGAGLVGLPPARLHLQALGRGPVLRRADGRLELQAGVELIDRARGVPPGADFAPPPPGVALLGAGAALELRARGQLARVGADARNLLNQAYREATSLIRYYADQPGRDIRVWITLER